MRNIILGGIDIGQILAQRAVMRKDAFKFISNGIEEATKQFNDLTLLEAGSEPEAEALVDSINNLLEDVKVVSDVSGLSYQLPYVEGGRVVARPLSYHLEYPLEGRSHVNIYGSAAVQKLLATLQEMEVQCQDWYSSSC